MSENLSEEKRYVINLPQESPIRQNLRNPLKSNSPFSKSYSDSKSSQVTTKNSSQTNQNQITPKKNSINIINLNDSTLENRKKSVSIG